MSTSMELVLRLTQGEVGALDALRRAQQVRQIADVLRLAPRVFAERALLMRAALQPLRGALSRAEVTEILRVMSPPASLPGAPGDQLVAALQGELATRLAAQSAPCRVSLELWARDWWADIFVEGRAEKEFAWLMGSDA